jgi:hypothetical protein
MVSRKDISKNHRTVLPVSRDRLANLLKNLAQSKLLVTFLQWDKRTGIAVVHAKQPISKGQLLASTQEKWLPIRGSFVNSKESKGTSENGHLITFSVDRFKGDDSVESVNLQNQIGRYTGDIVWLDTFSKISKLESEIEDLRSILLRLDSQRASEQPAALETKTVHEVFGQGATGCDSEAAAGSAAAAVSSAKPSQEADSAASAAAPVVAADAAAAGGAWLPPKGFTVDAMPPGDLGAALVGRQVLYWWPDDGWQRGTVARLCRRGAFSHVVAYTRQTSALRGTADSLLDSASYSARWVLLSPAPATGIAAEPRARRPRP